MLPIEDEQITQEAQQKELIWKQISDFIPDYVTEYKQWAQKNLESFYTNLTDRKALGELTHSLLYGHIVKNISQEIFSYLGIPLFFHNQLIQKVYDRSEKNVEWIESYLTILDKFPVKTIFYGLYLHHAMTTLNPRDIGIPGAIGIGAFTWALHQYAPHISTIIATPVGISIACIEAPFEIIYDYVMEDLSGSDSAAHQSVVD